MFLEAIARGLCVIAADNSGARDVIRHGVNGMLAPTGSSEVMVDYCLLLVKSPDLASAISTAASESAQSYTWTRVAKDTLSFYQDRLAAKMRENVYLETGARNGLTDSISL